MLGTIEEHAKYNKVSTIPHVKMGRVTLTLLKGHDRVHQRLELPQPVQDKISQEVFAKWKPDFDQISHEYFTDANGYDIVRRDVFRLGSAPFSSSLFPVDASISLTDYAEDNAFTVWNDRPQGGSVHSDKAIILNVQRYVATQDNGGLPASMYGSLHYPDDKTVLNFQLKAYPAKEMDNWTALRSRTLLPVLADKFATKSVHTQAANLLRAKAKLAD